jgi:hypothetical protein
VFRIGRQTDVQIKNWDVACRSTSAKAHHASTRRKDVRRHTFIIFALGGNGCSTFVLGRVGGATVLVLACDADTWRGF